MRKLVKACALIVLLGAFANYTVVAALYTKRPAPSTPKHSRIQIALLLDTSSSMDGLIEQAKSTLWTIVDAMSHAEKLNCTVSFDIALYEYGNAGLSQKSQWIRQIVPFTNDLDLLSEQLYSLRTNGGDEYCPTVVVQSIRELNWGKETSDFRMIVIAGNEEYQQGKVLAKDACELARNNDIALTTVYCGAPNDGACKQWQSASICGGGAFATINTNEKVSYISTPYDSTLSILNTRLNSTYYTYNASGKSKKMAQEKQDMNSLATAPEVMTKRIKAKNTKFYNNASWDLLDGATADTTLIQNIPADQQPEELRALTTLHDKKVWIAKKKSDRQAIQKEIDSEMKKHDDYVAAQRKLIRTSQSKTLDVALVDAIKKLAEGRQFTFAGMINSR